MAKVCVFIPVFNTELYVEASIQSVLDQTYTDFELVIVDDCSTDGTYEICDKLAQDDKRIKLYRNDSNLGMMQNWNHALQYCDGDYWAKLDADDLWESGMISSCLQILEQDPEVGLVCSKYVRINKDGHEIDEPERTLPDWAKDRAFKGIDLVSRGPDRIFAQDILRQGIGLMQFRIFKDRGEFTLLDGGDTEMWFRIGAHYKIYGLDKVLHRHRVWEESFVQSKVEGSGKFEQNIYDARQAIFNYYHQQNIISTKQHQSFSRINLFNLLVHKNYLARVQKKWVSALSLSFQSFFCSPSTFVKFYWNRLMRR